MSAVMLSLLTTHTHTQQRLLAVVRHLRAIQQTVQQHHAAFAVGVQTMMTTSAMQAQSLLAALLH
jgi:hypothetical protein